MIRWLGEACLTSAEVLQIADPDIPRWKEVLRRLVDYPQDRSGLLIWANQPLIESHRHFSHLLAIHPLGILNIEGSEADRQLISRSLAQIRQEGTGRGPDGHTPGCLSSPPARVSLIWLGICCRSIFHFICINTFHINGDPRHFGNSRADYKPMTLEAGFAASAAIMEMLLQSWGGKIRVFPAVPDFWPSAYFEGLRAEGAFLVTARREAGLNQFVEISSEAGQPCRIDNPFPGKDVVVTGGSGKRTLRGNLLEFETQKGAAYLLIPAGAAMPLRGRPAWKPRQPESSNWFGTKKIARF